MHTVYHRNMNFLNAEHIPALSVILTIALIGEILMRRYKNSIKHKYQVEKDTIESLEDVEKASIVYYNRLQVVDVIRIVLWIILGLSLITVYDVRAFNFLAVAMGAIIISLRDVIISLLSYVYVITAYDIGDDVRIGGVLGEIVRMKPFHVSIAGKEDSGDYNGRLFHIPNAKFITEVVERQELKAMNYRRVSIQAIYNKDAFGMDFEVWLGQVKAYLEELLPKRTLKDVGNYKGYAGLRYKINFDYDEDGEVIVKISFICNPKKAIIKKEEVIAFIESMRKFSST